MAIEYSFYQKAEKGEEIDKNDCLREINNHLGSRKPGQCFGGMLVRIWHKGGSLLGYKA